MRVENKTTNIDFLVMDAPSAYNTIFRWHWIYNIKVILSSLHQVIRCVSVIRRGSFHIKRDQMAAKEYYSTAIKPLKSKKDKSRESSTKETGERESPWQDKFSETRTYLHHTQRWKTMPNSNQLMGGQRECLGSWQKNSATGNRTHSGGKVIIISPTIEKSRCVYMVV